MINIVDNTLTLGGKTLDIVRYEVWWRTPVGLHEHRQDAIKKCNDNDWNPISCVAAVAVAIDNQGRYEAL